VLSVHLAVNLLILNGVQIKITGYASKHLYTNKESAPGWDEVYQEKKNFKG
jgi:hypothetical protein